MNTGRKNKSMTSVRRLLKGNNILLLFYIFYGKMLPVAVLNLPLNALNSHVMTTFLNDAYQNY